MISVKEAENIILECPFTESIENIPLEKAIGRLLGEAVYTDRNYPPYDKSIMDGIAINFQDYNEDNQSFAIIGTQPAGHSAEFEYKPNSCIKIMTGAVVPDSFNCVIPIEKVMIDNNTATLIETDNIVENQFIKKEGDDCRSNCIFADKHSVITPPIIAMLASTGHSTVNVLSKIRTAIVSTGDEIIQPEQHPQPFQIRTSNDYFIKTMLEKTNQFQCDRFHFKDTEETLINELAKILNDYDCIIVVGGVSMGEKDYIPSVLAQLNVEKKFHKVAQKPGKPMWYGQFQNKKPVFGLPGNPVSSYTCSVRFVRHLYPLVKASVMVISGETFNASLNITEYKMICIKNFNGQLTFSTIPFKGSGDLVSLSKSDGFIEIPPETEIIKKGESVKAYLW